MAEGTPLAPASGGDEITDEDITGAPRLGGIVPSVPVLAAGSAAMKLERTKVAVNGPFPWPGDGGDATEDNPLYVSDVPTRRLVQKLLQSLVGDDENRAPTADLLQRVISLLEGSLIASPKASGEVNSSFIAAATTAQTALLANPLRQGATFYNDRTITGAGNAYLLIYDGVTTPTTSKCGVPLIPGAYFELPYGITARVDVIWDSSTGNLNVQEFL